MAAIVGTTAAEPAALKPDGRATTEGCNDEGILLLHRANEIPEKFALDLALR